MASFSQHGSFPRQSLRKHPYDRKNLTNQSFSLMNILGLFFTGHMLTSNGVFMLDSNLFLCFIWQPGTTQQVWP